MSLETALIFFQFLVLVFALSFHECAHAWTAWRLGDATAFMLGRVSLNPFKQLTWLGSVILPLVGMFFGLPLIGWAKPTPVNGRNFKRYKRDDALVTMAGPFSNLLLAFACLLFLICIKHAVPGGNMLVGTAVETAYGDPAVSLDGLPKLFPVVLLLFFGIMTNVALFLFNLIPIPPLDGSHLLRNALPYRAVPYFDQVSSFGIILLYLLVAKLHILSAVYAPVLGFFERLLITL